MGMSEQMIVFKLQYDSKRKWGAISNFITRFSEGLPMKEEDVHIASSCVLNKNKQNDHLELMKKISYYWDRFQRIGRPENIYFAREQYEYIFLISIAYERLYDVVELQNLYLILNECRQYGVFALISGKQGDYFKTSHFFSFLTEGKRLIYERIFFKTDIIRHLQTLGIGVLTKFLPLIPVDAAMDAFLRCNVNKYIPAESIERYLSGMEVEKGRMDTILIGALKKLSHFCEKLAQCDQNQCAVYLGDLNILAFLLFCFSLEEKSKVFSGFEDFREELRQISFWADGCMQLIENIVFHSGQKRGAFSFRLLDGETGYIKEKYALADGQGKWIELMITDYPGSNRTLNLAEKFRKNLVDADMKRRFEKLTPRDFFSSDVDENIREAWQNYYSVKGNMINHYGLKIFQNVVKSSKGCFMAQSHSTHFRKEGDLFYEHALIANIAAGSSVGNQPQMCLPGTGYSILFPVGQEAKMVGQEAVKEKFSDYGIEDYEDKINDDDRLFEYAVIPQRLNFDYEAASPQEKEVCINRIAQQLQDDSKSRYIISADLAGVQGNKAEILYKSVILAMSQCRSIFHVVLYGCRPEFVQMFLDACYFGCRNLGGRLHDQEEKQIALYTAELYEEIIILPRDWNKTLQLNRFNNFSRETRWKDYFEKYGKDTAYFGGEITRYPFDILVGKDSTTTIFEQYVETVVKRNIQKPELGCKMENIHMRLGSTIHVNHFYEAEVLFGNSLFVERFALLMIKRMLAPEEPKPITSSDKLTLYGYTTYSEQTVFITMKYLREILPGIDVDYAILERETEERGFAHVDRIRYNTYFAEGKQGEEERRKHFQSREIICIIPIASTLKTNEKMINLFVEENGKECRKRFKKNFELILVGSTEENKYWNKEGKRILGKPGMEISPEPEFFVEVELEYMEPLKCTMCFPDQLIDELPLIETNATSTIPNQAFGLLFEAEEPCRISEGELLKEEDELEILRDTLLYRHLDRNENHFLFYFQTEQLIVRYPEKIRDWLKGLRSKIKLERNDYVVLFCPAHFSNAGFIEFVNNDVFGNRAVVIRDDVNKEYRCNFITKFSNLRSFVKKIADWNRNNKRAKRNLRFYYVDDAIVTGRTFQRAKSLVQSVIEDYEYSASQRYVVFDGIFVLVDRNSKLSKWQYTGVNKEENFYAFRTVSISSIRNHGDACVYCNLAREAGTLKKSSVTKEMEKYWEQEEKKFLVKPLAEYIRESEKEQEKSTEDIREKNRRAFRRLVCTNNAMIFLDERYHGNQKVMVLEQLLMLILEGSTMHKREEAEYFLSYCKALSRPFRVFDKAVKEAVFDFLLLSCWCVLSGESYEKVIKNSDEKAYLKEDRIVKRFQEVERFVKKHFAFEVRQRDFVKVLLKQLTEMKSNFIMRESVVEQILSYADKMNEQDRKGFINYYKYLIKKLTGVSSDTSKGLWLDQTLKQNWEQHGGDVWQDIYVENVWIYQDAFQKLNERVKVTSVDWVDPFDEKRSEAVNRELVKFETEVLHEYITPYQFKDFISLLQLYGLCGEDDQLTEKGKEFVASNFLLFRFISSDFENSLRKPGSAEKGNLTKVDYIAVCMKYILAAKEIIIIMEFDAEYDSWENKLIERYNRLLPSESTVERIEWKPQKEYIILGSSVERKGGGTIKEKELLTMQDFQEKRNWTEKGYFIDKEQKKFYWELGHTTDYPVYIIAGWEESEPDGLSEVGWLNRIRSVLQYYWLLNNAVFNRSNEGFFYEIARQRKKNAIHSKRKAITHTKSDIKLAQYNHVLGKERYDRYYQSDLLLLLADLNVSEHYRNSLAVEYYLNGGKFRIKKWNSPIALFKEYMEFYVINSDMEEETKLIVSNEVLFEGDTELSEDERIVTLDHTNAERELFLLIYSLMVNAVTDGRGRVEENGVTVYFSKTPENDLRIANEIGENTKQKTPEKIMEELEYPPEEENQGISLWSMSRYIKCIIAHILNEKITQAEEMKESLSEEMLMRLKDEMFKLLRKEFQIVVKKESRKGKDYFCVLVPVFADKYQI